MKYLMVSLLFLVGCTSSTNKSDKIYIYSNGTKIDVCFRMRYLTMGFESSRCNSAQSYMGGSLIENIDGTYTHILN